MSGLREIIVAVGVASAMLAGLPAIASADGSADEQQFLQLIKQLPFYALPNGRFGGDADNLAGGYWACAVMDRYPNDPLQAARVFYSDRLPASGNADFEELWFMRYASSTLCNRHADMYPNL